MNPIIRESFVCYNTIAAEGKLCKITTSKGKNGSTKLGNGFAKPGTNVKDVSRDYAYIVDFEGSSQELLQLFNTLHQKGICWKRNQVFYNDNPTSFIVLDFDLLAPKDEEQLLVYTQRHENVFLSKSNSYQSYHKISYKAYVVLDSAINVSGETFRTTLKKAINDAEKDIFGNTYIEDDGYGGINFTNEADHRYYQDLLQLVYNQFRDAEIPPNTRIIDSRATYKEKTDYVSEMYRDEPIDEFDFIILDRQCWEYKEISKETKLFKYNNFTKVLGPRVKVTDCNSIGYIPNAIHRITTCKVDGDLQSDSPSNAPQDIPVHEEAIELPPNNYANLDFIDETFNQSHCHRRYLPTSMRKLIDEWGIRRYFTESVYAPWLSIPILKSLPRITEGTRHNCMVTRINRCIFNLITANRILAENNIPFKYNLYHVFLNVKNYCQTRFDDYKSFAEDHDDKQIYKTIVNAYKTFNINKMQEYYEKNGYNSMYQSRMTVRDKDILLFELHNIIDGDFSVCTWRVFDEITDSCSIFFDFKKENLWKYVRQKYKDVLPKGNQAKLGLKYKTKHKFANREEFINHYNNNKHDSYWKKYHKDYGC